MKYETGKSLITYNPYALTLVFDTFCDFFQAKIFPSQVCPVLSCVLSRAFL